MKNEQISEFLQSRITEGDFPSAVYLVAERGEIVFQDALGLAVVEPEKIEARFDTIYDLASLTKVLVTGLLCARLLEKKGVEFFDFKISKYFSEFDHHRHRTISFENLLTHTSGLPAWKPFYLLADEENKKPGILTVIASAELESPPNTQVKYSDLNFIILGFLLEKHYGKPIDEIAKTEIFESLGLENTFFNPPKELKKRIAASEKGNAFERQTCLEQGFDVSNYNWREYQIRGEVHDGNCYFLDGASGHAGLFSTAEETFRIAQQFVIGSTKFMSHPGHCWMFRKNFTPGLNEARSIGFQLAETPESTASEALAKDSFGHLGFTGTSLWIEPERERIFILLTNRTHAHALPFVNINSVRRRFHELAQEGLNAKL